MKKIFILLLTSLFFLCGCTASSDELPQPTATLLLYPLPDTLSLGENGIPVLNVYIKEANEIKQMDAESYLLGVVAGEMNPSWPEEALKAQAVLARTFLLKFITEKQSQYEGADISTDITEAQAYDEGGVNDKIKRAVEDTKGMILVWQNSLPNAWFYAHSGGVTAEAFEGLEYKEDAPYVQSGKGYENREADAEATQWTASFTQQEIVDALAQLGVPVTSVESVAIDEKGKSGRAVTLDINGTQQVSAPAFRLAIGSTKMRSTLLDNIEMDGTQLTASGKGYGHGVGMSQWGAYALANNGLGYKEIIEKYFSDIAIEKAW